MQARARAARVRSACGSAGGVTAHGVRPRVRSAARVRGVEKIDAHGRRGQTSFTTKTSVA